MCIFIENHGLSALWRYANLMPHLWLTPSSFLEPKQQSCCENQLLKTFRHPSWDRTYYGIALSIHPSVCPSVCPSFCPSVNCVSNKTKNTFLNHFLFGHRMYFDISSNVIEKLASQLFEYTKCMCVVTQFFIVGKWTCPYVAVSICSYLRSSAVR